MDEYVRIDYKENKTALNFIILLRDNNNYLNIFDEIKAQNNTISISLSNELSI